MDDACVSMLCDVLVKYPNCKLRKLWLDGNLQIPEVGKSGDHRPLSRIASAYIATLLKQTKTLRLLSLSDCHGLLVAKIAEGIRCSTTLTQFYMNDCGLMDDDVVLLCEAVETHPSLMEMGIDGNNTMVAGFTAICKMLKTNHVLTNMRFLRSLPEVCISYSIHC